MDGEWRVSNDFATAVDSDGNLLNYLEAAEYNGDQELELSRSASNPCKNCFPSPSLPLPFLLSHLLFDSYSNIIQGSSQKSKEKRGPKKSPPT